MLEKTSTSFAVDRKSGIRVYIIRFLSFVRHLSHVHVGVEKRETSEEELTQKLIEAICDLIDKQKIFI